MKVHNNNLEEINNNSSDNNCIVSNQKDGFCEQVNGILEEINLETKYTYITEQNIDDFIKDAKKHPDQFLNIPIYIYEKFKEKIVIELQNYIDLNEYFSENLNYYLNYVEKNIYDYNYDALSPEFISIADKYFNLTEKIFDTIYKYCANYDKSTPTKEEKLLYSILIKNFGETKVIESLYSRKKNFGFFIKKINNFELFSDEELKKVLEKKFENYILNNKAYAYNDYNEYKKIIDTDIIILKNFKKLLEIENFSIILKLPRELIKNINIDFNESDINIVTNFYNYIFESGIDLKHYNSIFGKYFNMEEIIAQVFKNSGTFPTHRISRLDSHINKGSINLEEFKKHFDLNKFIIDNLSNYYINPDLLYELINKGYIDIEELKKRFDVTKYIIDTLSNNYIKPDFLYELKPDLVYEFINKGYIDIEDFKKHFDVTDYLITYLKNFKNIEIGDKLNTIYLFNEISIIDLEKLKNNFDIEQIIVDNFIKGRYYLSYKNLSIFITKYKEIIDLNKLSNLINKEKFNKNTFESYRFDDEKTINTLSPYINFGEKIKEYIQNETLEYSQDVYDILNKSGLINSIVNIAKKDIVYFIKTVGVHDNILFLEHLKNFESNNTQLLLKLVIKPIINQVSDLEYLNELLGYFDINKYITENGQEEINSFKKFELIAKTHKYDIKIPSEADENWREVIKNLLNAPGINTGDIRQLINLKFGDTTEFQNDDLYINNNIERFIEFNDNFSKSDINNLLYEYQNTKEEEDFKSYSSRFGELNFSGYKYNYSTDDLINSKLFFETLEKLSSCTIIENIEESWDYHTEILNEEVSYEIRVIYEGNVYTITTDEFKSITGEEYEVFLKKHKFKLNHKKRYSLGYYSDFHKKLVNIIDGVDDIDKRQIIPTFSETFAIDNVNEIVFNALGIYAFNQDSVKYSKLFRENNNFVEIVEFFKKINEEQKEELYKTKQKNIELFPKKADYYTAEYNKKINHDTILNFTDGGNIKGINYHNTQDLIIKSEKSKEAQEIITNLLLDNNSKKIILNTLKNIDEKFDKVEQNIELSNFKDLRGLYEILKDFDENNIEEKLAQIKGYEITLMSLFMYLGFNNLTRQTQSSNIKKALEEVINQEKYTLLLQEKYNKKPALISYIDGDFNLDTQDTNKVIEILKKFNLYKKLNSIKVEIVKKSDSRGWVCGNHTNCCMGFATYKNQEYLMRDDTAYFLVSMIDENNDEKIIAQSVLVAANSQGNDSFDTLAIDNIEVANHAIRYNAHLEKAYGFLKERFSDKKIIIGTKYNDDGGVITGNCRVIGLEDTPIKGDLGSSDCFGLKNAYLFHSTELSNEKYQNYGLTNYNLDSTILKKYITTDKLEEIRLLLNKIGAGEDDLEGGLLFPDNYSRIITKDQKLLGFIIAADYVNEDHEIDTFTFEDIGFMNELDNDIKTDIIKTYLEENKVSSRFEKIKVKNEVFELLPKLENFSVKKVGDNFTTLEKK